MEYYSAIKNEVIVICRKMGELEIMLREVS
jgi:hypothetical protein